jgi:streptogramin lyase
VAVGTVVQLHLGGIVQSTTTLNGHLWVMTCHQRCSHPWSTAVRGQLIELSSGGRPIKRFSVTDPGAIAGGDGAIWLAHFYTGEVARIDPQTGQTTASTELKLPEPITSAGDRRFIPSAISFSAEHVWASTARGWTAEIDPRSARLIRMASSSSQAPSATTAAGLTWVADELYGIGTFTANSPQVVRHKILWAGQPLSIDTVAHAAGLIWTLGWRNLSTSGNHTVTVVTTIDPRTRRALHQWQVPNRSPMVPANGGVYISDNRNSQLVHLIPPDHVQVLHGPKAATLTAATSHALWATTRTGQLLRIELKRR